jgi:PA14 domain/Concanavalin A-like lectin/glucanases superfamily/F5/8 type C domain
MSQLLVSKLDAVKRKHVSVCVSQALVAALGLFVLALAAGMLLDWWLELSTTWRATLLGIDLAAVLAILVRYALLPIIYAPDVEQTALWVEREEPSFSSRLISAVQFMRPQAIAAGVSQSMVKKMVVETEAIAEPLDFTTVIKTDRLARTIALAAVAIVIVLGTCVYAGATSVALFERAMLVPGIEIPRRTQIESETKDLTVARGDSVTLAAVASGMIPSGGSVKVQYDNGTSAVFTADRDPQRRERFTRVIENVQDPFTYTMYLGDNHSQSYHVDAVIRPAVSDLSCTEIFPTYTRLSPQPRPAGDLSLLAGGRLAVGVKANKPVKSTADNAGNHIHFYGSEVDYPLVTDPKDQTRLTANDGTDASVPVPPGTTGFTIELVDQTNVRSKDPAFYRIDLVPDRPPTVRITYPEQKESTVTPVAQPNIGIEANDDFALGKLAIRYNIIKAGQDPNQQNSINGMTATYFDQPDFTGKQVVKVDPAIDFDWTNSPPATGIAPEDFSVRWVGSLRPLYTEYYVFHSDSRGGIRIYIDGKLLVSRWPGGGNGLDSPPIMLQAGHLYPFKVEYRQLNDKPSARIMWRSRRQTPEVIPQSALFNWYNSNSGAANPNLAEGKTATQSSVHRDNTADRAVDGVTDGNMQNHSIAQTENDLHAWWQVDLGVVRPIDTIEIYNRLDEARERMQDFYVLVSDVPFTSTDLNETLKQTGVFQFHQVPAFGEMISVPVHRTGRYVRVQLNGQNFLQLAEVKVLAAPATKATVATIPPEADGLVDYWTFDDSDEGYVGDLTGQAVGVNYNAKRVPGKIGKAIDFAGADQRVEAPATPGMDFIATDSFTLSAWMNARRATAGWHSIISKRRNGQQGYGISIDPAGQFAAVSQAGELHGEAATPGWHLVTLVQDASAKTRTIYVDGVAGQSGPAVDGTGGGDLIFGGSKNPKEAFDGSLDDVRLYARALHQEDIAKMVRLPQVVKIPTPAELAGANAAPAESINLDLAGQTPKSLKRRFVWDLTKLTNPVSIGDTIEFWAEAQDTNDVTGPGIGTSEHYQFHILSETDKRAELMSRMGDYLGQINDVSETQRDLNAKLGAMITAQPAPGK